MKKTRKNFVIIGQPELLPKEPSWHVRSRMGSRVSKGQGVDHCAITWELVWGLLEKDKNQITVAVGDVHHCLSGPTAEGSIRDMAKSLNAKKYQPPKKQPKTRADGFNQPASQKMPMNEEFKDWSFDQ